MTLEELETACIQVLAQSANPLVPVARVLARVREEDPGGAPPDRNILEFLATHDRVKVVGAEDLEGGQAEVLALLGGSEGPWAVLRDRIPSQQEMLALMAQQLEQLEEALKTALDHAKSEGDLGKFREIKGALERAERLRQRVSGHEGS